MALCLEFLDQGGSLPDADAARVRRNLLVVLFSHNDFVTIR